MKISLYITSYNQKAYLIEAIESVLNQTLRPFEIIIVDDCSSDGSREVIAGYGSCYPGLIKPVYHTRNQGVAQTRRDALRAATGEYVTYVDGDDRLLPTKLEKEARLLKASSDTQIAFSNYYYITVDGIRTGVWADKEMPPQGYVFRQAFAREFPRGSLFRNELVAYPCLREVGFHDDSLLTHEDWDLKIRLTKRFKVAYCPEPLAERRRNPDGLSRLPASLRLSSMKNVYEKNHSLLDDLLEADRVMIEKRLSTKFAQLARMAVREELGKGNRKKALEYWLESLRYDPRNFDSRLVAQVALPRGLYSRLRALYRSLCNEAKYEPN